MSKLYWITHFTERRATVTVTDIAETSVGPKSQQEGNEQKSAAFELNVFEKRKTKSGPPFQNNLQPPAMFRRDSTHAYDNRKNTCNYISTVPNTDSQIVMVIVGSN